MSAARYACCVDIHSCSSMCDAARGLPARISDARWKSAVHACCDADCCCAAQLHGRCRQSSTERSACCAGLHRTWHIFRRHPATAGPRAFSAWQHGDHAACPMHIEQISCSAYPLVGVCCAAFFGFRGCVIFCLFSICLLLCVAPPPLLPPPPPSPPTPQP